MADNVVDHDVDVRSNNAGARGRRVEVEAIDSDGGFARGEAGSETEETVSEGGGNARVFKPSTLALLEKLGKQAVTEAAGEGEEDVEDEDDDEEAGDSDDAEDTDETTDEEVADPDDVDETEEEAPPAKPTKAAPAPAVDPTLEWRQRFENVERTNRQLLADLDTERKKPRNEVPARLKALSDAEEAYVNEGPAAALRRLIAVVFDAAPDSEQVTEEMAGAYLDLTAKELGVPLDQSQKALREAARARLALARDKRERKAESEKPAPAPADDGRVEKMSSFIGSRMTTKNADGKSISERYPLLMTFAEDFDGMKPDRLLAAVLDRDARTGAINVAQYGSDDDRMIDDVAKKIESHYQALADKIVKARSTHTTKSGGKKPANAATTSEDQRQSHGTRITNANAGTAPAKPPTKKKAPEAATPKKLTREQLFDKHKIP